MKYTTSDYKYLNGDLALHAMQYDTLALCSLSQVSPLYAPWNISSLRPSAVRVLLNDIVLNTRTCVVELGTGISTLFLADALARTGGRLLSVDHDAKWQKTISSLANPNTRDRIQFIHAPLKPCQFENALYPWYDTETLAEVFDMYRAQIDLVLVDGPAAFDESRRLARGPAIPFLRPYIAENSAVVLDDIARSGEQEIAAAWSNLLGQEYLDLTVEAGIAVWQLGRGFNIALSATSHDILKHRCNST